MRVHAQKAPGPAGAAHTPAAPAPGYGLPASSSAQVLQHLLRSGVLQAKLTVSQPGDPLEEEADRVAETVMRMPAGAPSLSAADPGIQRKCSCSAGGHICDKCSKEEEKKIQTKEAPGRTSSLTPQAEAHVESLRGGGQPLPSSVRSFFEPRFGRDFSGVRIHSDSRANEAASAVQAHAFTLGKDIVFGAGQYAPKSAEGQKLLAHELTHVIQQGNRSGFEAAAELQRSPLIAGGALAALAIGGYGYYKWGKECFTQAYRETLRATYGPERNSAEGTGGFRLWYYDRTKKPVPSNVWDAFGHCHIGCHGTQKCGRFNTALPGIAREVGKSLGKHLRITEHDSFTQDINNQALGRRIGASGNDCEETCSMASVEPGAMDLSAPAVESWKPERNDGSPGAETP